LKEFFEVEVRQASLFLAQNASGTVRVVLGTDVRADSIWITTELPALISNKNVTKIITIDPMTLKEIIIHTK